MIDILECEVRLAIGSIAIVQFPGCVWLFLTPWTATFKVSLSLTSPEVCPSSCPLHLWCHPAISSSDAFFSFCPQSFARSGTFPMSQLFTSNYQNTRVSALATVLPMNIQGWFLLRLASFISLLSMELSGVFSSTTVQGHLVFHLLYSPALTTTHDHWEDHNLEYMDFC